MQKSVLLENGALLAGRHLPQLDRLVIASRGQHLAVRVEGDGTHRIPVRLEGSLLVTRAQVPQLDPTVPACRGQRSAIRTEGDGAPCVRVSLQRSPELGFLCRRW